MPIYTRTGDKGETSLFGGKKVPKSHYRINAYGSIDELNSWLGLVLVKLDDERVRVFINSVQKDLFIIGSYLANAPISLDELQVQVDEMEKLIDWIDERVPKLRNFIIPEGVEPAVFLFATRAVARRAERELVALNSEEEVDGNVLRYINRLSDLLFMMARYLNKKSEYPERIWQGVQTKVK